MERETMNISKTSGISFEGKFKSEHINDKFDSNEINCLFDFTERAKEFMKNSTGDNDVVELRFKDRDVILVHKNPESEHQILNTLIGGPTVQANVDKLFRNLQDHMKRYQDNMQECQNHAILRFNAFVDSLNNE